MSQLIQGLKSQVQTLKGENRQLQEAERTLQAQVDFTEKVLIAKNQTIEQANSHSKTNILLIQAKDDQIKDKDQVIELMNKAQQSTNLAMKALENALEDKDVALSQIKDELLSCQAKIKEKEAAMIEM